MAASQALSNPTTPTPILRGLLIDLDEWVNRDITPPDSVFPVLTKGCVVSPETLKNPAFEGSAINKLRLRSSELVNAKEGPYYPVKVPKVNRNVTPIGSVTLPEISVPTGTICVQKDIQKATYIPTMVLIFRFLSHRLKVTGDNHFQQDLQI